MSEQNDAPLELKLGSTTQVPDNESSMRAPVELQDHGEPVKEPIPNEAYHGRAALDEVVKTTKGLLTHAFDSFPGSASKDKSFISEYFDTKDYESHSPLLRKYAEAGHVPSGESLTERTKRLVGR